MVKKHIENMLAHYGIGNVGELKGEAKQPLHPAEQEYADALVSISEKYGKFADRDEKGIWVGYVIEKENDNLEIGVACKNCHFYEGQGSCKIVKRSVEPGGYCRLAAIHPGAVKS